MYATRTFDFGLRWTLFKLAKVVSRSAHSHSWLCPFKQFIVTFALKCGCRVSFKFFVGLFVVTKCVPFCRYSLFCPLSVGKKLSSAFSRFIAFCLSVVKLVFGEGADYKVEVTLLLVLFLVDSDSSFWRDRTALTPDAIGSVGIFLGVREFLSP